MAPIFTMAWTLSQAKMPITSSRLKLSAARSAIDLRRPKNATSTPSSTVTPMNPNISAKMANIESFCASGV